MAFLLAALSGMLMAVQGAMNAVLGKFIGVLETTVVVHIVGTVLVVIYMLLFSFDKTNWQRLADAPWYSWLGGVVSLFIIYLVAVSIPQIGMANATTAIIVGQVLTAVTIDYLGMGGLTKLEFDWTQLLGVALLAAGAKLLIRT